ncbi:MAG: hypothetical protein BGO59_20845 [Spirosoma sp. 48-14]|nr:MAG: hypothetical protein BGO59_20845 [Spirosoma sp. 48-14]
MYTTLMRGEDKHARNLRYKLSMQDDGNLVIYQFANQKLTPIWSTGTNNKGGDKAIFQADGNFVLYDFDKRPIWASNTKGRGAYMLLQNDGNLVMYDRQDKYVWSTKPIVRIEAPPATERLIKKGDYIAKGASAVATNKKYWLTMQDDGNLVLYKQGKAIWATGTNGKPVKECIFQDDGNFVLYDVNDNPVWASNTERRGNHMVLQNDGNLVIYDVVRKPIWNTDTWER